MSTRTKRFELLVMPHLDAGHNLARWLLRDRAGAQDVLQESALRALSAIDRFEEGNARAWFLAIVRNQCYTWLKQAQGRQYVVIDDEAAMPAGDQIALSTTETPESLATKMQDTQALQSALERLPVPFREVLILKELEELSYKEIAGVTEVPIGTVMSRLARGREMLKKELLHYGT